MKQTGRGPLLLLSIMFPSTDGIRARKFGCRDTIITLTRAAYGRYNNIIVIIIVIVGCVGEIGSALLNGIYL